MLDQILPFVTSPWIYLLVFGLTVVDAIFPPVPAGAVIVALGAFAAAGAPDVVGLMAAAAAGAFVGDTIAYGLGRFALDAVLSAVPGVRAARDRVRGAFDAWGGGVLVVARFVPAGRTAVTVTAGSTRYPIRRFWLFIVPAGALWAGWTTVLGYAGGSLFDSPVPGAVGGLALAALLSVLIEAARQVVRRRSRVDAAVSR